jgi:MFS family permease
MNILRNNPGFRTLWTINFVSSLVGWSLGIALSVHIYQLTGSAMWTSVMVAAPTLSGLALGHFAGIWADRFNPLRIVQVSLSTRVVILIGLFAVSESPIWLVVLVVAQSAVQQVYRPAEQVLIADFTSPDKLAEANGLNSFASNATRLIGPALGGFVIAAVGFGWTAIAMTCLMLISCLLSFTLGRWQHSCASGTDTETQGHADTIRSESADTYTQLLHRSPRARGLVLIQVLDAVKEGPLSALFPVLMLGVVGATSAEMGLANSAFAVSAVIAGPLMGLVIKQLGYRLTVAGGALIAHSLIVILAIWPSFPMAIVVFVLSGLPFTLSWVGGQTWLLLTAPRTMRGRAIGTTGALYSGVLLITTLGSGAMAELFGVQWVIGVSATLAITGLICVQFLLRKGSRAG